MQRARDHQDVDGAGIVLGPGQLEKVAEPVGRHRQLRLHRLEPLGKQAQREIRSGHRHGRRRSDPTGR